MTYLKYLYWYSRSKITSIVENMLGHRLITKQTPKEGILVNEVMVAESVDIKKETYFCLLLDRYIILFNYC